MGGRSPPTTTRWTASSTAHRHRAYLKRLLVGGLERVYEIARTSATRHLLFKHNPEFTVVEWYEAYATTEGVMRRVEELLPRGGAGGRYEGEIDFTAALPPRHAARLDPRGDRDRRARAARPDRDALAAAIAASGSDIPTTG